MVWKLPSLPDDQKCDRIYGTMAKLLADQFVALIQIAEDLDGKPDAEEKKNVPEMASSTESFLFDQKINDFDRWRLLAYSLEHLVTEAGGNTAPELTCLREAALHHLTESLRGTLDDCYDEHYRDEIEAVLQEQRYGEEYEYECAGEKEEKKEKTWEEVMEAWDGCVEYSIFWDCDWQMDTMFGGKIRDGVPYYSMQPSLKSARARFPTWGSIVTKADEIVAFVKAEMGDGEFTVERYDEVKATARQQRQARARQALAPPSTKRARKN